MLTQLKDLGIYAKAADAIQATIKSNPVPGFWTPQGASANQFLQHAQPLSFHCMKAAECLCMGLLPGF